MKNTNNLIIKEKINIMKNQLNSKMILALSLIAFYSCTTDDFLEKPPLNELSTEVSYASKSDAEAAVGAIYGMPAQMNQHYYKWQHTFFSDMRADNTHSGFVASIINVELGQPNAADIEPIEYPWSQNYSYIAAANTVIDNIPGIEDPKFTDAEKNVIMGQAYFLRGYYYFHLARLYGGVPLTLSTTDTEILKARSTQEAVFAQVESDLLLAESLLPKEYSDNFLTRSRATKGGSQAMLAKLYAETGDYTKSAEYSGKVISSGVYDLLPTFDHLWDGEHEYNRESIFEMVHVPGTDIATYVGAQVLPPGDYSQYDGNKSGFNSWEVPYHRFNTMKTDLVAAFKEMGDTVREESTIFYVPYELATQPNFGYLEGEPIGHTWKMGRTGEIFDKHNVILIRLADIILLRAEALNQIGQTGEAVTLLNQVRARVNLAPTTASSSSEVALAILKERRLELVVENNRFWDLKRYYNDDAKLTQHINGQTDSAGNSFGVQTTVGKVFIPIPQSELDVNPNLTQNPGY
jgi:tetratricopeptide (TPR) repeat protein